MDEQQVDRIHGESKEEESRLLADKSRLSEEVAAIDSSLARIQQALAALEGNAMPRSKPSKPSPKKDDVRNAARNALHARHALHAEELRSIVGAELQGQGFSRAGLALRLKEVLSEESFAEGPDGIFLKEDVAADATG
ncbi:MAG: hypothetical protein AAGJ46_17730 [Planctomycetota bacterium]